MRKKILKGYSDFWQFIKSPRNIKDEDQSINFKVLRIVQFLIPLFIILPFIAIIQQVLEDIKVCCLLVINSVKVQQQLLFGWCFLWLRLLPLFWKN